MNTYAFLLNFIVPEIWIAGFSLLALALLCKCAEPFDYREFPR
jgi:hypothetical protein